MDLDKIQKIHFIGIGGIGTSSLAQILKSKGKKISGSDQNQSEITEQLAESGIIIKIGHHEENIPSDCELVIHSHAIPAENPELTKAKSNKIATISYPEALSLLSKSYFTIAISGTHGKSTTTAMTSLIFTEAGFDPTVIIGTKIKEFQNRNYRVGESKYLILEACEYKGSFLNLSPDVLAVTNIEAEHLDFFKTEENYYQNFYQLISRLGTDTKLVLNSKDQRSSELRERSKVETITSVGDTGFSLKVPGEFNQENASLAAEIARSQGVDEETIKNALQKFEGTWRRMEKKSLEGFACQFVDDYAHHPTEIKVTLKAIRDENPEAKILCIFQPHQYSRTHKLLKEFAESFSEADEVIIPNIYEVRDTEEDKSKVNSEKLIQEINQYSQNASNGHSIEQTAKYIKGNHQKYDIVITMGAGDITSIYEIISS